MSRCRSLAALLIGVVSIAASGCSSGSAGTSTAAAAGDATAAGDAANVRLVGSNDMQGRYALQVTTRSDAANGNWVYVGNVANPRRTEGLFNPITKQHEPIGHFCDPGRGNFGPHQHAETVNGALNPFTDELAWIAYVNAGVRVVDISDPYHLIEVGHFIPKTNVPDARRPIELTDVDIDHRGLVYATDRSGPSCMAADGRAVTVPGGAPCMGTGLFVLQYTGPRAGATTN